MLKPAGRPDTAAAALLSAMKAGGVTRLLANSGTDFPPIIEALAAAPETGLDAPEAMVVHHESVAVGMAHGHWLASGRPLAVMVHVNVGLANAAMGLINAAIGRVPILMCSGRTPLTEGARLGARSMPIHWGQEMRDQTALVRESVKWDCELRYPEQAGPLIARALALAQTQPRGPVYLSLPREVLAEPLDAAAPGPVAHDIPSPGPAAAQAVARAAAALIAAERPAIVVQRTPAMGDLPSLGRLAALAAIPVVEFWASVNVLPTAHPMHAGFDPAPVVDGADAVLCIDAIVPWLPGTAEPAPDATIIALGPDPLETGRPHRGFAADIALQGDVEATLAALCDAMEGRVDPARADARRAAQAAAKARRAEGVAAEVARGAAGPMNHAYVSQRLSALAGPEATFISELGADPAALDLARPGALWWTPLSGGLGWGLPAALGARLAEPERTVIATVGDGSYMFANPAACHQTAALHGLPVLTVVFDNGRWNAVKASTAAMYPDGRAARANLMPLTALGPQPDYAAMARAHGAHAERVEDPALLDAAIERALRAVRAEGRQALLAVAVA